MLIFLLFICPSKSPAFCGDCIKLIYLALAITSGDSEDLYFCSWGVLNIPEGDEILLLPVARGGLIPDIFCWLFATKDENLVLDI